MKKKTFATVLCATLCALSITACGGDSNTTPTTTTVAAETTTAPKETEATTAETTTAQVAPTSSEAASIEGTTYSNPSLGFSVTLPDDWTIFDHDASLQTIYASMNMVIDNVDEFKKTLEASNMDYPFYAQGIAEADGSMPNIIAQSMPLSNLGGMKMEDITNQIMDQAILQYKQQNATCTADPAEKFVIDGQDVYVASSKVVINGEFAGQQLENYELYQKLIAFSSNDNLIVLNLTYFDSEDTSVMEGIQNTLKFIK